MSTGRMEAFSDGVLAIVITVMVLELPVPHGTTWAALHDALPVLLSYVLSFVYVGIYWSNLDLPGCGGRLGGELGITDWAAIAQG